METQLISRQLLQLRWILYVFMVICKKSSWTPLGNFPKPPKFAAQHETPVAAYDRLIQEIKYITCSLLLVPNVHT